MRKLLLAFTLLSIVVFAQAAGPHHNDLTWSASPTTGLQGYKVYRAACTGTITGSTCSAAGAFAAIATLGTVLAYSDTTVAAGNKFDYYVTAFCPAAGCSAGVSGESVPSNHWAATTPPDSSPNPASSLNGTAN